MNEDGTPIEEAPVNPDAGLLIDNNTGEAADSSPLNILGIGSQAKEEEPAEAPAEQEEQEQEEDQPAAPVEQPKVAEQPQAPAKPLEDPGEFQPQDYSFQVTLADGTTYDIKTPEDVSQLPQDAAFASIQEHTSFINQYTRMVNGLEADKRTYDQNKQAYDEHTASVQEQEQYIQTLENSLQYLETKGKLPEVPAQYREADWNDPEVAKQPGVKERIEIINHMAKENAERDKLGLPKMSVLEAHAELQNQAMESAKQEQKQKQQELTKKRGAMVSGQSAPAPSASSNDMIVGSGGSLRDI